METMRQPLSDFIEVINKDKLITQFPDHDIYLWSNFGFNETKDIDLIFVGDITPEFGVKVWKLWSKYLNLFDIHTFIAKAILISTTFDTVMQ